MSNNTNQPKTNQLIHETSPYLLQHAYNPVQWYPWGEEALHLAHKLDRPIFLSIGYSACHWCHVMEHECFEDEEIAAFLDDHFISIKVDREERPDIDDIYMTALQTLTGSGGWPMSMFLTPEGVPFYAGTYFPKSDQQGRPGFLSLLQFLHQTYASEQEKITKVSAQVLQEMQRQLQQSLPPSDLPHDLIQTVIPQFIEDYDPINGGFGAAPKFPASMVLECVLDNLKSEQPQPKSDEILRSSLRSMAQGGIYDQIGGGYHRYSTDEAWLVPHFEKMLYDNALLCGIHAEASTRVDGPFNLRIATEICDYVLQEMTHPNGAFFSTTDADSEGMEGKYFLWDTHEICTILGDQDGERWCRIYNIDAEAIGDINFAGGTPPHDWFHGRIPHLTAPLEILLQQYELELGQLKAMNAKLYHERQARIAPGRDEKVLAGWNGLMSSGMLKVYKVSGHQRYLDAVTQNLNFIWDHMQTEGRLRATWKDGQSRHHGTLEDYAFVMQALLDLDQLAEDAKYLSRAQQLGQSVLKHFGDPDRAFFYTADDAEDLIVRSKNPYDNAMPSANSVLVGAFYRLSHLTGDQVYAKAADGIASEYSSSMLKYPRGFARMIREISHEKPARESWVLASPSKPSMEWKRHTPFGALWLDPSYGDLPFLAQKIAINGEPTLYPCKGATCQFPVHGHQNIEGFVDQVNF